MRSYLVAHGIARTRLAADCLGAARPLGSNDTEQGRAQNRRVEFVIVH